MSEFDWDRKGPPRPGSSSLDHPRGVERPYVHKTEEQKRQRREELKKQAKERGRAVRAAEWEARFGKNAWNPHRD